ncbi:MAG: ligase-associated DNA damage response endonuclease PdeM [Armatimonadetes bacterium]|nr:ligase-associated DNA damage response endonuclease PdeM [Akkermansiaceae bacterium]
MLLLQPPHPPLRLLSDHALLIEAETKTHLLAADLHLGKSAAFRAHGLPVPEGDTARDLARLSKLILDHRPDHLVIAGDLFHAASGFTGELLETFLKFTAEILIPFTLVMGNHDRKIKTLPPHLHQPAHLDLDTIRIIHNPEDASPAHFNICGHIHPILRIPDGKNTSLRLPCFHLRGNRLTLPAFGSFTGGHIIKPQDSDRFFLSHQGKVIEVPKPLLSRG